MDRRQYKKLQNDLYYEHSGGKSLTQKKLEDDMSQLTDMYLEKSIEMIKDGSSLEEIKDFLKSSPVKNISWWILREIQKN